MQRAAKHFISMNDHTYEYLSGLTLPQLQALKVSLSMHIKARAKAKALEKSNASNSRINLPPIQTGCVSKAADALGLDISGLMRDVKRRSSN